MALAALLTACQQDNQSDKTAAEPSAKAATESALPEGITHIETVTQKGDEIVIPYQKYQLDNGLTVIIHEDHSDPLVHVDVTYHVGSAREETGKSGFASD